MCARGLFFLLFAIVLVSTETTPTEIIGRGLTSEYNYLGSPNLTIKFATQMFGGFMLEVEGILNASHNRFVAYIPAISGINGEENVPFEACEIVVSYDDDSYKIMSPPSAPKMEAQEDEYLFHPKVGEKNTFLLIIEARQVELPRFYISFEGNKFNLTGTTGILDCYVNSFQDFDKVIITEGIESIESSLFTFNSFGDMPSIYQYDITK